MLGENAASNDSAGERVLVESMGKEGFAKAQELHLAEMTHSWRDGLSWAYGV